MENILIKIREAFLKALYPESENCPVCKNKLKDKGLPVCTDCLSKIDAINPPFCIKCGKPFFEGEHFNLCPDCRVKRHFFEKARSYGVYEGILKKLIHEFKYNKEKRLIKVLGEKLSEAYERSGFSGIDLIVPVPLYWKRQEQRGFNQSLLLAKELEKNTKIRVEEVLARVKSTEHQTSLPKSKREENVKGAFEVKKNADIKGKNILLVDDVYTTGSTADECSKTLLSGGADMVYVITLARG